MMMDQKQSKVDDKHNRGGRKKPAGTDHTWSTFFLLLIWSLPLFAYDHHPADGRTRGIEFSPAIPKQPEAICVDSPIPNREVVVSVAEFGANPHAPDNYTAFQQAIDACQQRKASKLIIPRGVYHFRSHSPLYFNGFTDFVLDGQGSELIFHQSRYMKWKNCRRIVIKNVILDWDWGKEPLAYLAKIVNIDTTHRFLDFKFYNVRKIDKGIRWRSMIPLDHATLRPGLPGKREVWNPAFNSVESLAPDVLRVYPKKSSRFTRYEVGDFVCVRTYIYEYHAISFKDVSHVLLDSINIYSAAGMGFVVSGDSHHMAWNKCRIEPRPGTRRPISITADGIHVSDSNGYLSIENCVFDGQGDDAINIHDKVSKGFTRLTSNKIILHGVASWRNHHKPGHVIEFRNPDFSPTGFSATITEVLDEDKKICLTFDKEIPSEISTQSLLFSQAYDTTNIIIRGNRFYGNRARGILFKVRQGIIENNVFDHIQGQPIIAEVGPPEGKRVDSLIIRNNVFRTCNTSEWNALIEIRARGVQNRNALRYPIFTRILIEQNQMIEYPKYPILVKAPCQDLTIRKNLFAPKRDASENDWGAICIFSGSHISITDNTWTGMTSSARMGIYFEPAQVQSLFSARNTGILSLNTPVRINFQPASADVPPDYLVDTGKIFANQGNGYSYGWNMAVSEETCERNLHTDQRYDTLIHIPAGRFWEIALPKGNYRVHLLMGDPSSSNHINTINVEGVIQTDPDGADNFDAYTMSVNVADGRLTLKPGPGAMNPTLCFIEISPSRRVETPSVTPR